MFILPAGSLRLGRLNLVLCLKNGQLRLYNSQRQGCRRNLSKNIFEFYGLPFHNNIPFPIHNHLLLILI